MREKNAASSLPRNSHSLFLLPKSQVKNHFSKARTENDSHQRLGICHRLFNFIVNSLIGRGVKRVTWGSTNHGQVDEYAGNGVQEPLRSHAKPDREERVNSKLEDDSDSVIQIRFKRTEELEYCTPIDDIGSSVHVAAKDEKTSNKLTDLPWKEISLSNGFSATKPQGQGKTQVGEGSRGSKIIIPITDSVGQEEKKKQAGNKFPSPKLAPATQPDKSKPILTGLGLNINEISETFIQNTRERMRRNVSGVKREES